MSQGVQCSCSDYNLGMSVTLDKPLLEKIEAPQNLMIASVTGGIRNEVEYRQIREEVFDPQDIYAHGGPVFPVLFIRVDFGITPYQ